MVKFVHFGDTHLGRRNFKLEEREKDFENAFKQVIDFAIREKVDFVIHSGDVFDTGRPRYKVVNFLVSQLYEYVFQLYGCVCLASTPSSYY